jgi:hypothetical protein
MKQVQAWVQVLSDEELQLIHRSSTRLLERLGVRMPHAVCLAACRRAGAQVDEADGSPACQFVGRLSKRRLSPPLSLLSLQTMRLAGSATADIGYINYEIALARAHQVVEEQAANYSSAAPVCTTQQFDELNRIVSCALEELANSQSESSLIAC